MNDVINRKDAIGAILSIRHIAELRDGDAVIRVSAVNYVLRNLPSADVQPVVRCRDCKWFNKIGCAIKIVDESDKPHEDDFCSFAERKKDE